MRIDELTITNFKCFENETFRFNPHFNVVIGKNASGKSSLLDAVAAVASCYFLKIMRTNARLIYSSDIRREWIDGQPRVHTHVILKATGSIHSEYIDWKLEGDYLNRVYLEKETVYKMEGGLNLAEIFKSDLKLSRSKSNATVFPIIVYYHTNRLSKQQERINFNQDEGEILAYNDQKEGINYFKQEEGVSLAYKDCLSGEGSGDVFLSWYKTYEDEVKKFKQPLDELFLRLFRETISSMVPEWTDMEFSFKDDDMMGMFKSEDGQINKLPFRNLSDGYRNMIGMVADMVYRCIQLNPGLKENVLTETDGIVLIDELDLHLHPEWQRRVVGDLKRIFPKVQFVVTTHSPFIIQSLKKDELIILDKNFIEDKDPLRKSVEEISENEMQVTDVPRSKQFKEMVDIAKDYYTLVKQNDNKDTLRIKINDAKQRLDKLRIRYSDDPAYVAMLETELEKIEHNAAHN